jgi:hypothetical protein
LINALALNAAANLGAWATPLHVTGLILMLISFGVMLSSKQINKQIQKKKKGDFTFSLRLIGWGFTFLFALLTII